jgi:hypothetical protein
VQSAEVDKACSDGYQQSDRDQEKNLELRKVGYIERTRQLILHGEHKMDAGVPLGLAEMATMFKISRPIHEFMNCGN